MNIVLVYGITRAAGCYFLVIPDAHKRRSEIQIEGCTEFRVRDFVVPPA